MAESERPDKFNEAMDSDKMKRPFGELLPDWFLQDRFGTFPSVAELSGTRRITGHAAVLREIGIRIRNNWKHGK
jgi:hypothetical protein